MWDWYVTPPRSFLLMNFAKTVTQWLGLQELNLSCVIMNCKIGFVLSPPSLNFLDVLDVLSSVPYMHIYFGFAGPSPDIQLFAHNFCGIGEMTKK